MKFLVSVLFVTDEDMQQWSLNADINTAMLASSSYRQDSATKRVI